METTDNKPSQLKDIPVDRVQASPYQVRSDFGEAPLADSLDLGLANPILVRLIPAPAGQSGDWYELIDGERRLRAHKLKEKATIRAIVEGMTDEEAETKVLIANIQRKDLNPIEEARGFERMEKRGKSQEAIARIFGKTRTYINEALRLLDLPVEVQGGVTRGTLTPNVALLLLRLPTPEQRKEVGARAAQEKWTVKRAEQEIQKAPGKSSSSPHATVSAQVHQYLAKESISFKKNGSQLIVTAPYDRTRPFEEFLTKLQGAYLLWNHKNPFIPTDQEAAEMAKRQKEQEDYAKVMAEREANLVAKKASSAPSPAATPSPKESPPPLKSSPSKAASFLDELDPETRAMVEEDMKLGKII